METTEALSPFYSVETREERSTHFSTLHTDDTAFDTGIQGENLIENWKSFFSDPQPGFETEHLFSLLSSYWMLFNNEDFVAEMLCKTERKRGGGEGEPTDFSSYTLSSCHQRAVIQTLPAMAALELMT